MAKLFLVFLVAGIIASTFAANSCGDSNASMNICGSLCQPTCDNPNPNPKYCPRIQCTKETTGCRCNKGFYANGDGKCVPLSEC